jgi:hypothetical protein
MRNFNYRYRPDQPASYRIAISGKLDARCSDWFDDASITVENKADGSTITTLVGSTGDQSALHGWLGCIRDLGLVLPSVQRIDIDNPDTSLPGYPQRENHEH